MTPELETALTVVSCWWKFSVVSTYEFFFFPRKASMNTIKSLDPTTNLPEIQGTGGHVDLGWEDSLEKEMETHSSILAWRIPWTEEPGGL